MNRISKEIKEEVLAKVREGHKVKEVASMYGISDRSIYAWLSAEVSPEGVSQLKYNKLRRENDELKRIIGLLTLDLSRKKKVQLIKSSSFKKAVSEALGVHYKNVYRKPIQEDKDLALKKQIEAVHRDNPAYGHRRVAIELGINHKRALRVMNKYGIKPPRRKRKHLYTTVSTTEHRYTNLIKDRVAQTPHEIWSTDLTYLKFHGQTLYLSTIKDQYSRLVLGASLGTQHNAPLVLKTIKQAIAVAATTPKYFHSDQGKENMARVCTEYLEALGVHISVSDTGSPWQNPYQESFFGRFKTEIGDINRFDSIGELAEEIYSYLYYFNHKRIHTALKMSPRKFVKNPGQEPGASMQLLTIRAPALIDLNLPGLASAHIYE